MTWPPESVPPGGRLLAYITGFRGVVWDPPEHRDLYELGLADRRYGRPQRYASAPPPADGELEGILASWRAN